MLAKQDRNFSERLEVEDELLANVIGPATARTGYRWKNLISNQLPLLLLLHLFRAPFSSGSLVQVSGRESPPPSPPTNNSYLRYCLLPID